MKLCELCFKRLIRTQYSHVHYNVEQNPDKHYFCSHACKILWVSYVRETGIVPITYVEVFR